MTAGGWALAAECEYCHKGGHTADECYNRAEDLLKQRDETLAAKGTGRGRGRGVDSKGHEEIPPEQQQQYLTQAPNVSPTLEVHRQMAAQQNNPGAYVRASFEPNCAIFEPPGAAKEDKDGKVREAVNLILTAKNMERDCGEANQMSIQGGRWYLDSRAPGGSVNSPRDGGEMNLMNVEDGDVGDERKPQGKAAAKKRVQKDAADGAEEKFNTIDSGDEGMSEVDDEEDDPALRLSLVSMSLDKVRTELKKEEDGTPAK